MYKRQVYGLSLPKIGVVDILEIIIIAFALYHVTFWVKRTRAWTLVKGVFVLFSAYIVAYILDMSVILWVFDKTIGLGITALLIVFQPELRKALEEDVYKRQIIYIGSVRGKRLFIYA